MHKQGTVGRYIGFGLQQIGPGLSSHFHEFDGAPELVVRQLAILKGDGSQSCLEQHIEITVDDSESHFIPELLQPVLLGLVIQLLHLRRIYLHETGKQVEGGRQTETAVEILYVDV